MDSPPISEPPIRLLNAAGLPCELPREWQPHWVEVDVPPMEWETAELRRNGLPLPVALRRLGGAVHPEKLSPAAFARLLEDLKAAPPRRRGRRPSAGRRPGGGGAPSA
ncbi:MAG TPA: hypothetical protein VM890_09645 [Longimicrobium sp.]|nr:hypothetical protein [Longimicrobium sp.]